MKYRHSRSRLIGWEDLHGSQQTRPSGRFAVRRWSDRGECCWMRSRARAGPCGWPTRHRGAPPRVRPEAGIRLLPALLRARLWLGSMVNGGRPGPELAPASPLSRWALWQNLPCKTFAGAKQLPCPGSQTAGFGAGTSDAAWTQIGAREVTREHELHNDCHINRRPIETPTLHSVNLPRLFGSQRALESVDFTEFERKEDDARDSQTLALRGRDRRRRPRHRLLAPRSSPGRSGHAERAPGGTARHVVGVGQWHDLDS